ncbi:MAG TPA: DUF3501 family protein [Steroidobacteraceae bacterium]|nr:DUF3501 family protein [Steroidobacteraceae bacterium]
MESDASGAARAAGRLSTTDLMSLEQYARERPAFRARVLAHKRDRQLAVGAHCTWCFEDRLTIQYQVQEMLRAERIFEADGIAQELDAYNPLVPDGTNWKVTLLIEYPDPAERRAALERLKGIEDRCWIQVAGQARVFAIADEDLERENEEKTSAVHFLRFELDARMRAALRAGAVLSVGIDHDQHRYSVERVPDAIRASLIADLEV